jgi:WD40 repeat protein
LTSLAVSADGSVVVAGASDGATTLWNGHTGRRLDTDLGSPAGVLAVAVSANGELAASGDRRGLVRVWDARTGKLHWSASQHGEVTDVEFSPDGSQLVTASSAGAVVWSTASDRPLHKLRVAQGVVRAVFSPDGKLVAAAGDDGTARVWFARTGNLYRIFRGHRAALTDLAFSFDGILLATSAHDADGRVWNVATGRHVHVLRGHSGNVAAIAFSPNRRWIATAGPISAGLWPESTGRILFYLRGHTGLLTGVSFSPDGKSILTTDGGTVRTYRCDVCGTLNELVAVAEHRLARAR